MREIEFRAKGLYKNRWYYGNYVEYKRAMQSYIIDLDEEEMATDHFVDKKTLGQYTGIKDKNGTKIFEGDIVKLSSELTLDDFDGFIGQVKFELGGFNIVNGYKGDSVFQDCRDIEVIGNIYDNPELTHQHEDKGE